MSDTAKKRAFVDGLSISYGLMSMKGRVLTAVKSGSAIKSGFKLACPLDGHQAEPHAVSQRYVCAEQPDNGESFTSGDCLKRREAADGTSVIVSSEAVQKVKLSPLPERTLELRAHPYDPSLVFAAGSAYVFEPEAASQFYLVLRERLDDQGIIQTDAGPRMLIGMVAYKKGSESFVRLERWGDQIVIRDLVRPEDVDDFEKVDGSLDTKLADLFGQLVEAQTEDFEAETYRSSVVDRVNALVEQAKNGEVEIDALAPKPVENVQDLTAMLEASLAAARAAKV